MKKDIKEWIFIGMLLVTLVSCNSGGSSPDSSNNNNNPPPPQEEESRELRAIAGVSMGAYGAMNIGTKHPDLFVFIGALGGPIDLMELLRHMIRDNLEVKPAPISDDQTFDHFSTYPERDTRITMLQDLMIAFGNPFLHHEDSNKAYLAFDSEPALLGMDDQWGRFTPLTDPVGFLDGGDINGDGLRQLTETPDIPTEVLLLASGSLASEGQSGDLVGNRELIDLDQDGVYDYGDGIVVNYSETFSDDNENLVFEPDSGEVFDDYGLDGVPGTGDFGENNGIFDYDPDRAHWLSESPLERLKERTADEILSQRIYMDVGTRDEFNFEQHYTNIVELLQDKGIDVTEINGFSGSCVGVPNLADPFLLIRYEGGHIGFADADSMVDDLLNGDFCESVPVWERLLSFLGAMNESFPEGHFGISGPQIWGETDFYDIPSPALNRGLGDPDPIRTVLVYRPPEFFNTDSSFPIVYFLGGYGQSPDSFERMGELLDLLITAQQVQNVYFAFLPGRGGQKGSFYVDHQIPVDQVASTLDTTSGRYETSIIDDLIPYIEDVVLEGRISETRD